MSGWAGAVQSVESKLVKFVQFAVLKLDNSKEEFEDDDTEDENYNELCTFACGMSRNLKSTGSGASPALRSAIRQGLINMWDIGPDRPGAELREGGVDGLRAALMSLIEEGGALASAVTTQAEQESAQIAAEEAHTGNTKPDNIVTMSFQEAVTYLWKDLDKGNRLEWGDSGFT